MKPHILAPILILFGSLLILIGFCLPWFSPYYGISASIRDHLTVSPTQPSASGFSLWLGTPLYRLNYAPDIASTFFPFLWLLPLAALLTCILAYLEWYHPQWDRRWVRLVAYSSLHILMGTFFASSFVVSSFFRENVFLGFGMLFVVVFFLVLSLFYQKFWRGRIGVYLSLLCAVGPLVLLAYLLNGGQFGLFLCLGGWLLTIIGSAELESPMLLQYAPRSMDLPQNLRLRRGVIRGLVGLVGVASLGSSFFLWWRQRRSDATITTYAFSTVTSVAWSPDSKRILTTLPLRSWEALTGHNILSYQYLATSSATWSPNGLYIAAVSNNNVAVTIFNAKTGQQQMGLESEAVYHHFSALTWSPDGQNLALGVRTLDDKSSLIRIWHPTTEMLGQTFALPDIAIDGFIGLCWSPDGSYLAASAPLSHPNSSGLGGLLCIWDVQKGSLVFQHSVTIDVMGWYGRPFCWSPDSQHFALCTHSVEIWNLPTQRRILNYQGHLASIFAVNWSPNGSLIASGGEDGQVQVWDATTGELRFAYVGHTALVWDVAWSPDGLFIASCGLDGTARVWQPEL